MYVTSQSTHQCSVVTVSRSVLPSKALHYFHSLVWVHLVTSVAVVHSSLACFAQFTVLYISTLYVPNGNFTSLLTSCNALLLLLLTAVCILVAPLGLLLIAGNRLASCVLAAARSFFRFLMPPECSDCSWNISIVKPTRCNSFSNLFYFGTTLYVICLVFPSIIRSSRLYIQQQLSVWHTPVAVCTVLNSWWWMERPSKIK